MLGTLTVLVLDTPPMWARGQVHMVTPVQRELLTNNCKSWAKCMEDYMSCQGERETTSSWCTGSPLFTSVAGAWYWAEATGMPGGGRVGLGFHSASFATWQAYLASRTTSYMWNCVWPSPLLCLAFWKRTGRNLRTCLHEWCVVFPSHGRVLSSHSHTLTPLWKLLTCHSLHSHQRM